MTKLLGGKRIGERSGRVQAAMDLPVAKCLDRMDEGRSAFRKGADRRGR